MNCITRHKLGKAIADKILSTGINPWVAIAILFALYLGITVLQHYHREIADFFKKGIDK